MSRRPPATTIGAWFAAHAAPNRIRSPKPTPQKDRPMYQIAKDQNGRYHLLVDGEITDGPVDNEGRLRLLEGVPVGKLLGGVVRIHWPVGSPVALEVLGGTASSVIEAIASTRHDPDLDALMEAEIAGKHRETVKRAIEKRRDEINAGD